MPSVQRAHEEFQKSGVVVLAVSIDGQGAQAVKPYIAEHKYTMRVAIDPDMQVAREFGVRATPTTFVVDRTGHVVASTFGPVDLQSAAVRDYIKALAARPQG
jgi:peroxiredoxin